VYGSSQHLTVNPIFGNEFWHKEIFIDEDEKLFQELINEDLEKFNQTTEKVTNTKNQATTTPRLSTKELLELDFKKDKERWEARPRIAKEIKIEVIKKSISHLGPNAAAYLCEGLATNNYDDMKDLKKGWQASGVLYGVDSNLGVFLKFPILVWRNRPAGDLKLKIQGIQFLGRWKFHFLPIDTEVVFLFEQFFFYGPLHQSGRKSVGSLWVL